ncbi:MAG TPA: septum formation family protein [Rugosimonospora sp.]|nr:septum formation family protein [Rugosimonospora sp.]
MGHRRSGWLVAATCALAAFAAAGCSRPAGVDGDLTNGWPAFPQAKTPVPAVGACYGEQYAATWYGPFDTVSCDQDHASETAYVGTFTGADGQREAPPNADSPSRKTAYLDCVNRADDYLGGDWHTAYVWLGLVLPSPAAWSGGARWYRCDLLKTSDVEHSTTNSTGSVKDGLRSAKPIAITCINTVEVNGQVQTESPADCAQSHSGELAGVTSAADIPYPGETAAQKQADTACETVVAHYLGFTGTRDQNASVGWLFFWPRQTQWDGGDRTFSCFAYAFTKSKKMTGSVKGIGAKAPQG